MANSCETFIAGKWSPPKSDKRFDRENPATGETIGSFPDSGPDDVADAVAAAAEAYPPWRPTPAPRRAQIREHPALPPGVVNLVFGEDEAGAALVRDPRVAMVSFTGSLEVGREIASYCGAAGKRGHPELGGKNAPPL